MNDPLTRTGLSPSTAHISICFWFGIVRFECSYNPGTSVNAPV